MSALYNSPVLYDRSKSIVEAFSVKPHTRKLMLFADHGGLSEAKGFVQSQDAAGVPYELYYLADGKEEESEILASTPTGTTVLRDAGEADILAILRTQKMGAKLYLSGFWKMAEMVYPLAIDAGFAEDEIQVFITGQKARAVFCPKCYSLTSVQDEEVTRCSYCGVMLNIGPHYSRVRKGYLGYPFV